MQLVWEEMQSCDCFESKLAEDHRSRTCPGPLAVPTGVEVQPPHRRRRSSAPALLHGGGAHYSYFRDVTTSLV